MRRSQSWGDSAASYLPARLLPTAKQQASNGSAAAQLPSLATAVMIGGILFAVYIYTAAPCLTGSGCTGNGRPFACAPGPVDCPEGAFATQLVLIVHTERGHDAIPYQLAVDGSTDHPTDD